MMHSPVDLTANDLHRWSDELLTQGELPRLVRNLILATIPSTHQLVIPVGEGVRSPGWDGLVLVSEGNVYVPDALSAWEMSVQADPAGKATADYEKRTGAPGDVNPADTTFVFVTSRRWAGKAAWVDGKRKLGVWRDVRAYDAEDLVAWLELAPARKLALETQLGRRPHGARDLDGHWIDWSSATIPSLSEALVLAGRELQMTQLRDALAGAGNPLYLRAASRGEAVAFVAACLRAHPWNEAADQLARAVVVLAPDAWDILALSASPMILIPLVAGEVPLGRAIRVGHSFIVPLGPEDRAPGVAIELPPLDRSRLREALVALGVPEDRARDLAVLGRRSLASLRRQLGSGTPADWVQRPEAPMLLAATLAGGWTSSCDGDRAVLESLTGIDYAELEEHIGTLRNTTDPPFVWRGDARKVTSPEESWDLLRIRVTREHLERLKSAALTVLGEPDPCYDLDGDKRWMAGAVGKPPSYSRELQQGLAETLALIGSRGQDVAITTRMTAADYVAWSCREVFERANGDWRIWATLAVHLPALAEAAPEEFLAAIDVGLHGTTPVLQRLFEAESPGILGSSPHCGLLWALEVMAWSPDHFGRACQLLVRCWQLDPGGRLANRPGKSLRTIFLPWLPYSSADLGQRLGVLDVLRARYPEQARELMASLLPKHHDFVTPIAKPKRREWPCEEKRQGVKAQLECIDGLLDRLIEDARNQSPRSWVDLINALDDLSPPMHDWAVGVLQGIRVEALGEEDALAIWAAMRELIANHRQFPEANWVLPGDRLAKMELLLAAWEPDDPVGRSVYLFTDAPKLPLPYENYAAHDAAVGNAQRKAVEEVLGREGPDGLMRLLGLVEHPYMLGVAIGSHVPDLASSPLATVWREALEGQDLRLRQFGVGAASGIERSGGRESIERLVLGEARDWGAVAIARLLLTLPKDPKTWELVDHHGAEVEAAYWVEVDARFITAAHCNQAARKLIDHGRPSLAVEMFALHVRREPDPLSPHLILEALDRTLEVGIDPHSWSGMLGWHLGEVFSFLQHSEEVSEDRMAALELQYLPILSESAYQIRAIYRVLERAPDLFCEAVCHLYRREGEDAPEVEDPSAADRAHRIWELLHAWTSLPGRGDEGQVDGEVLVRWVDRVRACLAESGRSDVGDEMVGEVLSRAPVGSDGSWPHEAIRTIIEDARSEPLERGIEIGVYNSRGVVTKDPEEGGLQERGLVERYLPYATALSTSAPRTAAMLRRIAGTYERDARREDTRSEEWGEQ